MPEETNPDQPDQESTPDASEDAKAFALERAFLIRAAKEHCLAPEDALKLANLTSLTQGEEGQVDGLDQLFEGLREDRPYLFRPSQSPGLDQSLPRESPKHQQLQHAAQQSGLTRDIHLWRQSARR